MPTLGEARREGQRTQRDRRERERKLTSLAAGGLAIGARVIVLGALLGATARAQSGAPSPPPAAPAPAIAPIQPIEPLTAGQANAPATLAPGALAAPAPAAPVDAPVVVASAAPVHEPFYEKWWFWTAVGAVAVTTFAILIATSGSSPPHTDFGNMPAF